MEELKMVAETIQSLGGDAKTAFIIWIIATKLVDLSWVLLVGGSIWVLLSRISKGFFNVMQQKVK